MGVFAVKDAAEFGDAPRDKPSCYPGDRPDFSYLLHDGKVHELRVFGKVWDSQLTWGDRTRVLQDVLDELGLGRLEDWFCILAYGSNACPPQLVHKKFKTVVVIKCRLFDVLPVYAGFKTTGKTNGYVPATLARAKGQEVETFVTLLKKDDLKTMDRTEDRPSVYDLAVVNEGRLFLENGKEVKPIYAYVSSEARGIYLYGGKIIPLDDQNKQEKVRGWLKHDKLRHSKTSDWISVSPFKGPPPKVFGDMF